MGISRLLEIALENIEGLIDNSLAELFHETSHTSEAHFLEFRVGGLNVVKHHLNEGLNDLPQDVDWGIDQTLPNLGGLELHLIDWVEFEDEHS